MALIHVDVVGQQGSNVDLHLADLMAKIGALVVEQTTARFSSKTDPDGAGWPGWAPSTERSGDLGSLMVRSGALMGSITAEKDDASAVVAYGLFYGDFHQSGTSKMPARPFLGLGAEDIEAIDELVEAHLSAILGEG